MSFIDGIKERAKKEIKTIILPEADDQRVLKAAEQIEKEGFAKVVLIGDEEKVKKVAKYVANILSIISALVAGINAIEGITIPYAIQIIQVIAVVQGVISTYLLGQKAISNKEKK